MNVEFCDMLRASHLELRRWLASLVSSSPDFPTTSHQRGSEQVFFGDDDYQLYRDLLVSQCRKHGVARWATCLMPNHVH